MQESSSESMMLVGAKLPVMYEWQFEQRIRWSRSTVDSVGGGEETPTARQKSICIEIVAPANRGAEI